MINRPDFLRQVDLARNYLSQFHVNNVNDGQWFQAYGRKHHAEQYYRMLSPSNESVYISDTAFCVAHLMLGGKVELRDCGRLSPIRMTFIGRKKVNYQVSEPRGRVREIGKRAKWLVHLANGIWELVERVLELLFLSIHRQGSRIQHRKKPLFFRALFIWHMKRGSLLWK